jgi:hypothetical protein
VDVLPDYASWLLVASDYCADLSVEVELVVWLGSAALEDVPVRFEGLDHLVSVGGVLEHDVEFDDLFALIFFGLGKFLVKLLNFLLCLYHLFCRLVALVLKP